GRGADQGRRQFRGGDALDVSRGALLAGLSLSRRARGAPRRLRARVPTFVLPVELDARRGADQARRDRQAARPQGPEVGGRPPAEGQEVAAVRRELPRPVAEAPPDRGQRSRPEALPRVQPVPAGLDGRRDPRLLPGDDREEPAGPIPDRKSTRLNSSHANIAYA